MNKRTEDKILKHLTVLMEECGMPEFSDRLPAIQVLQMIKDFGFIHYSEIDKYKGDL